MGEHVDHISQGTKFVLRVTVTASVCAPRHVDKLVRVAWLLLDYVVSSARGWHHGGMVDLPHNYEVSSTPGWHLGWRGTAVTRMLYVIHQFGVLVVTRLRSIVPSRLTPRRAWPHDYYVSFTAGWHFSGRATTVILLLSVIHMVGISVGVARLSHPA